MSPGCILGARRVYRRCPVSSRYTWNIGVEHVDKPSGPPSLFPPQSSRFLSFFCSSLLSFPTSPRTSSFFLHNRRTNAVTLHTLGAQADRIPLKRPMRVDCVCLGVFVVRFCVCYEIIITVRELQPWHAYRSTRKKKRKGVCGLRRRPGKINAYI